MALISLFLTLVGFADPQGQELNDWWEQALGWFYSNRFLIATILMIIQGSALTLAWLASRWQAFDAQKVHRVLDNLAARHFVDQDRSTHHYRATLFKVRRLPPFGSWLGIVGRSGLLYPQRTTVFSINAKNRKHNTGVAGQCWRQEGQTIIQTLPEVRRGEPSSELIEQYKKTGFLDDREFDAMNVHATLLLATGIRVLGNIWGILILDTTDAGQLRGSQQQKRHREDLEFAAIALGELVS